MVQESHSQPTPLLSLLVFASGVLEYSCVPGSSHQPEDLHLWVSILESKQEASKNRLLTLNLPSAECLGA